MGHLHPDVECRIGYCESKEWQEGFRTNPGTQRDTDKKHTGAACREAEGEKEAGHRVGEPKSSCGSICCLEQRTKDLIGKAKLQVHPRVLFLCTPQVTCCQGKSGEGRHRRSHRKQDCQRQTIPM